MILVLTCQCNIPVTFASFIQSAHRKYSHFILSHWVERADQKTKTLSSLGNLIADSYKYTRQYMNRRYFSFWYLQSKLAVMVKFCNWENNKIITKVYWVNSTFKPHCHYWKTTLLIDVTEKSALCDDRICVVFFFSLVKPFDTWQTNLFCCDKFSASVCFTAIKAAHWSCYFKCFVSYCTLFIHLGCIIFSHSPVWN